MKSNELPNALVNFDQLPNSAYVRLPVMTNLYGVSATTIWRYVGEIRKALFGNNL